MPSITRKPVGLASITRRDFLKGSAALGAGMLLAPSVLAQNMDAPPPGADALNVALIAVGAQGRVLIESCLRIPGIRFKAICDIWPFHLQYGKNYLGKYGHIVNAYEDYRELLDKEKDLHAVLVASPDWLHAEHANAAMEAGFHVYCEKEMSNSLEKARSMVETHKRTGKLLQIGHQRRSNPRYIHAIDTLMHKEKLLGRVTHAYGQWNRSRTASEDLGWPKAHEIPAEKLTQYGYNSMQEFRNWRWYKKYGGGPIVDLGSHQIDIFTWVFGSPPTAVTADGGLDFYPGKEWYDNVMTIYEFKTAEGTARAFYQVLTTTSYGGFSEAFMGDEGSIQISEVSARGNSALAEPDADPNKWAEAARRGLLEQLIEPLRPSGSKDIQLDVRVSKEPGRWPLPVELAKPAHQPHLENFFDAIKHGTPLNCPAEMGYETAVMVLRANDAVAAGQKLTFKPEDFVA